LVEKRRTKEKGLLICLAKAKREEKENNKILLLMGKIGINEISSIILSVHFKLLSIPIKFSLNVREKIKMEGVV